MRVADEHQGVAVKVVCLDDMQVGEFYLAVFAENACADYEVLPEMRVVSSCSTSNGTNYRLSQSRTEQLQFEHFMYGSADPFEYVHYYVCLLYTSPSPRDS